MVEKIGSNEDKMFRKTWDTSDVPLSQQFSYFREGVCQAFFSNSPVKPAIGDIEARVELISLPNGGVTRLKTTPYRTIRTKADLAAGSRDAIILNLVLAGQVRTMNVAGIASIRIQGTSKLLDPNLLQSADILTPYRGITLTFDRSTLVGCSADYKLHDTSSSTGKLLSDCMALIDARYLAASRLELASLFNAAVSLLMAGLIKEREFLESRCCDELSVRDGILENIKNMISQELSNGELTTASVATRFGLSSRRIQMLFASEGTTFKTYLINSRLDRIHRDLADRSFAFIAPSEIAARWGFRDISTFYRNFKLRFGDTPKQVRMRMAHFD